jgi:hypothetical protein
LGESGEDGADETFGGAVHGLRIVELDDPIGEEGGQTVDAPIWIDGAIERF